MSTIYAEFPDAPNGGRYVNTTGADVIQDQFLILGGKCLRACDAIVSTAIGAFEKLLGKVIQVTDFTTGEGTFAASGLVVYWNPLDGKFSNTATTGYYIIGYTLGAVASGVLRVEVIQPVLVDTDVTALALVVDSLTDLSGRWFSKVVTLTAADASTPVVIVAASEVTGGKKVYVTDFLLSVNGGTAWTDSTGTVVTLQDTADVPVVGVSFAKAQLASQAQLTKLTAGGTLAAPIRTGVGFTANKGLAIAADSDFDAGSDISIVVTGYIA